mgnify:CR=1 FL=1
MTGSYKMMKHKSVFFKLPVVDRNFKMLAWTTTPWTLSANVSLAVNPEIDYVEVKVKSDEQPIVLAKNAIKYLGDDKVEVLRAFKGDELVGLKFETCFPELRRSRESIILSLRGRMLRRTKALVSSTLRPGAA